MQTFYKTPWILLYLIDDYILKLLFGFQQAMGLSFGFSFGTLHGEDNWKVDRFPEYESFREIMIHAIFTAVFFCQKMK